jgi:hypothetical protein
MRTVQRIAVVGFLLLLVFVIALIGWFETKQYRCKKRNAEFLRRVEVVEKAAREQLKVGTKKDVVARFYKEHGIPLEVVGFDETGYLAIGTLYTIGGCAPLGCQTDDAAIGVRVKLDAENTVAGEPEIVSMYTNCL